MLHYILQIIAFQLFFLLIYDAFLKRETFFNWNRVYLLSTALLSVVLPFIKIQSFKDVVPKEFVMSLPEVVIGNMSELELGQTVEISAAESSGFQFSWELAFYIGAGIAMLIFVSKLIRIAALIYRNPKYWNQNLRIVTLLKSNTAFSFFYYVFIGEHINIQDRPTILKHEAIHVNQRHTLDLLFFELLRIVLWFNPLIYMYQTRMSSLHEYIADAEAIKSQNKSQYYQDLLSQIFETENVSFINAFYKKSLIKKRIVMLSKTKSKQSQLIKYALLIPLVFGMLLYTSSSAQEGSTSEISPEYNDDQNLTDQELQDKYYVEMLELHTSGNTDEIFKDALNVKRKYLNTREEYYRFQANMKVILEMQGSSYDGDKNQLGKKINRSYAQYLEFKKTDEAKEIWENGTSDGILKMVVAKLGSYTAQEQKRYDNLMQLMNNDDHFHTLLVSDGFGSLVIEELETDDKIKTTKQTQYQNPTEIPFSKIDEVPTYETCSNLKSNEERRSCMANEISKFIAKNFNADMAKDLGLEGKQRISVIFKIDTKGNVVGVKARAANQRLEEEAKRVVGMLPTMNPGKHNGKTVTVPYSLPIIFQVNAKSAEQNEVVEVTEINDFDDLKYTEVPFSVIDQVPVFPGCEDIIDQKGLRKCMVDSISKFVQKKFNTNLAKEENLVGRQRISVIFKIDKEGNITNVRSRAPHPKLEAEAKRVINSLPKMTPGKHKGEAVVVPYSLPIVFQVDTNSKSSKDENSIEEVKKQIADYRNDDYAFSIVDQIPMLPGCASVTDRRAQEKCVSQKVSQSVQKNFNTDLPANLGLVGRQQISVLFKISKEGTVFGIRVRAPHPDLEAEAIRTIKLLPKFIPGEHAGEKVNVSYSLPIVFMVN